MLAPRRGQWVGRKKLVAFEGGCPRWTADGICGHPAKHKQRRITAEATAGKNGKEKERKRRRGGLSGAPSLKLELNEIRRLTLVSETAKTHDLISDLVAHLLKMQVTRYKT